MNDKSKGLPINRRDCLKGGAGAVAVAVETVAQPAMAQLLAERAPAPPAGGFRPLHLDK